MVQYVVVDVSGGKTGCNMQKQLCRKTPQVLTHTHTHTLVKDVPAVRPHSGLTWHGSFFTRCLAWSVGLLAMFPWSVGLALLVSWSLVLLFSCCLGRLVSWSLGLLGLGHLVSWACSLGFVVISLVLPICLACSLGLPVCWSVESISLCCLDLLFLVSWSLGFVVSVLAVLVCWSCSLGLDVGLLVIFSWSLVHILLVSCSCCRSLGVGLLDLLSWSCLRFPSVSRLLVCRFLSASCLRCLSGGGVSVPPHDEPRLVCAPCALHDCVRASRESRASRRRRRRWSKTSRPAPRRTGWPCSSKSSGIKK